MLGNRVRVYLSNPDEDVSGELRRQSVEGVWIYAGWAEKAAVRFYPAHRLKEIEDLGPVYR